MEIVSSQPAGDVQSRKELRDAAAKKNLTVANQGHRFENRDQYTTLSKVVWIGCKRR